MQRPWRYFPLLLLPACGGDGGSERSLLSRDEAAQLVIDELVVAGDPVIVLGSPEPIAAGDRIVEHHPLAGMVTEVGITASGESWFFWFDDEPEAQFDHASRFVMVDRATGEITSTSARWWPLRDGVSMWSDAAYDSQEDWVHAEIPTAMISRAGLVPDLSPIADCMVAGGHAVVINATSAEDRGLEDFDNDAANMDDAFTDAGLDTTHFGRVGTESVDAAASHEALSAYFAAKADELGPGDTLVVFLGAHGLNNEQPGAHQGETVIGEIWESDLEGWLAGFDPGVNVVVMINGCHSGGMLESLTCVADVAVAATNREKSSYGDWDPDGENNPADNGSEWTSSMMTCWNTLVESEDSRAAVGERATAAGTNYFTQLVGECFTGSIQYDAAEQAGLTEPQRVDGAPKTAPPQTDPGAPSCEVTPPDPECSDSELAEIAMLLGSILAPEDDACLPTTDDVAVGNETVHSDGEKTAIAEGSVDCTGYLLGGGLLVGDPLPCGGDIVCTDLDTGLLPGDPVFVAAIELAEPLETMPTRYYQYGFVFDQDGDTTNNYQAAEPYPSDFFDDTDLWLQLIGAPGQPWSLELMDVRNGAFAPVPSGVRVELDGDVLRAIFPEAMLGAATDMRFTTFVHDGDYGASMPWSGDVVPPVDEPKLEVPH